MSLAEMRGPQAIAGNPVSREIRSPLVAAGMVVVAVEIAGVARIAAAGKRADEDLL
jgi:hypothetical protein